MRACKKLEDPTGKTDDEFKVIIKAIESKIIELAEKDRS